MYQLYIESATAFSDKEIGTVYALESLKICSSDMQ